MVKLNFKTKKIMTGLGLILSSALLFLQTGCTSKRKPDSFIIWTDRQEFVSYSELFNSIQNKSRAVIVYKPRLANSLPPAKDEQKPDLLIGSWLKNSQVRKNFRPLENIISTDGVNIDLMYTPLVEYGKTNGRQYLLPVSFNLPLIIFSTKYENKLTDNYTISPQVLMETAGTFNTKNKQNFFTKMGFGPSWDSEFLYTMTKMNGFAFKEKGTAFTWNDNKLAETTQFIKNWTETQNESTTAEQDFQFKYLYTPKYRQVTAGQCLFSYTTSSELFNISFEQLGEVDYRWLTIDSKAPVEDDITCIGIYSASINSQEAENFIKWFFQEETQKLLLERTFNMQLDTVTFGISRGFSSVRSVNEHFFPTYYRNLLGNLPTTELISAPSAYPTRWESLKERVIYPYLSSAVKTDSEKKAESMTELLNAWSKQFD